ncbi:MAG: transposase [Actinobacteria bacterium]|nr:transposase [Actinomycetota bacterium]
MPRQARRRAASGIYHVMMRGVNRDAIFLEDRDCVRFLECLALAKAPSGCQVLGYCLMPNHVHLMLREVGEPISEVVKRLGIRYAGWFNKKYGRVGHLFQDRFRSVPVEDDAQVITLLRYIWNNPVEAKLVDAAEDYPWSSRRLLGRNSPVLDGASLTHLLTDEVLAEIARPAAPRPVFRPAGRTARFTDAEAEELLRHASGAESLTEFAHLDPWMQAAAIRALRTRSVPYDQIARLTGLSATRVRRIHVAGSNEADSGAA